jgi:hypothetical protein
MSHPLAIKDLPLGEGWLKGVKGLDEANLDDQVEVQRQPFGYQFRTIIEPAQATLIVQDIKYDPETQLSIGSYLRRNRDGSIQAGGGDEGSWEQVESWETCATSLDGMFILDKDKPVYDEMKID